MRYCLAPDCRNLVTKGRCSIHQPTTTQRGYGTDWQRISKAARAAHPWCSLCRATTDLTLDHTTGLVVCRSCHRSEKQGGVRRNLGARSPT